MTSITLTLHGRGCDETNLRASYSPTIKLNPEKKYEIAFLYLKSYHSIPNISEENNTFKYSTDDGVTWKIITIATGSYELDTINNEIQRQMIDKGDYDETKNEFYITISANLSRLTAIVNIKDPSYQVDFGVDNSIGSTLGFLPLVIKHGYNEAENIVDITKINDIFVNIDLISGSYINGRQLPVIHNFYPSVSPGYLIIEYPKPKVIYYPVNRWDIDSIRVWLTDQDNSPINLRCERITIKFHLREVQNSEETLKRIIKEMKN